jgi:hypothetical protein
MIFIVFVVFIFASLSSPSSYEASLGSSLESFSSSLDAVLLFFELEDL